MSNKIKFTAKDPHAWGITERPYPASQAVPPWWKDMTPYIKDHRSPDGSKLVITNGTANASAKKCIPMLDALTSGYIIPLWCDVQVRSASDSVYTPVVEWKIAKRTVFELHNASSKEVQHPPGYTDIALKFINNWLVKTPPGYSIMCTEPFGYRDLAFKAIPSIIDSDTSSLCPLFPVWIKDGFEGVVEKGTPIVQITPFKRENWESEFDYLEYGDYQIIEDKGFETTIVNHYIKNHWRKKKYK